MNENNCTWQSKPFLARNHHLSRQKWQRAIPGCPCHFSLQSDIFIHSRLLNLSQDLGLTWKYEQPSTYQLSWNSSSLQQRTGSNINPIQSSFSGTEMLSQPGSTHSSGSFKTPELSCVPQKKFCLQSHSCGITEPRTAPCALQPYSNMGYFWASIKEDRKKQPGPCCAEFHNQLPCLVLLHPVITGCQ